MNKNIRDVSLSIPSSRIGLTTNCSASKVKSGQKLWVRWNRAPKTAIIIDLNRSLARFKPLNSLQLSQTTLCYFRWLGNREKEETRTPSTRRLTLLPGSSLILLRVCSLEKSSQCMKSKQDKCWSPARSHWLCRTTL